MEAISSSSTPVYRSLQSYWRRRRRYQRIDEKNSSDDKRMVRLGGGDGSGSRKGCWKLRLLVLSKKVFVGVKVKFPTPKRLLLKLRDSYIGAMHSWAGTVPSTEMRKKKRIAGGTAKAVRTRRIRSQKEGEMSDFDKKMILHIYNTVMANPNPKDLMRA